MLVAVVAILVIGSYLVGLLSFKLKSRWCPACGSWTHRQPGEPEANRG